MSSKLNTVVLAGSTSQPSRSLALAHAILETLDGALRLESRIVTLADIARSTGSALYRPELPAEAEATLQAIESADLLVVSTPVFRGSLPGQLKHLLDLVGQDAFVNTPVLLAATGGSDRHALVIDHQLRPLFSFFQALTLPIGIYGSDSDFTDYKISNPALQARINLAVELALPWFPAHRRGAAASLRVA